MRFSLRTRVLAATLLLVALGLAVAGFATYGLLRKSLIDRLDEQLRAARFPAVQELNEQLAPADSDRGPGPPDIVPGTYAALYDESGHRLAEITLRYGSTTTKVRPELPANLPTSGAGGSDAGRTFSASAIPAGTGFRVLATGAHLGPNPVTVVVAIPFTEMNQTLHRLTLIELSVAAGVLVAIGLVSWWIVRLGLRPLDRMATTAGHIAEGDLSKRVEPEDDRTEVGRLGTALNTMLGQIEASFEEQRATEERLRRFVADASHELRTPLTSIRGYAELFRRGAAQHPEDLERAMRRIEDEGGRMGILLDDLLLLARLDQGRPLERKRIDMGRVVRDAVHDFRAAEPDWPVSSDIADGLVVPGDVARLHQVVANLLANARTHTPPGTPVSVRLSSNGDEAVLEVADHGPGLSETDPARVFERFYRGDPSRSRGSGGTGLGLSIVSSIVHAHGGTVDVRSVPGEGATFRVTLPMAPAGGAGSDGPEAAAPEGGSPEPAPPAGVLREPSGTSLGTLRLGADDRPVEPGPVEVPPVPGKMEATPPEDGARTKR
jgi:two-component system OmpR family sensor kinase